MKRKLTIIARTCGRVFALNGGRYVQASKPEIINKCLSSLVNSINQVTDHDIELFVLDDNSHPDCLIDIKKIINQCNFPSQLISLEGTGKTGPNDTCKLVYKLVEDHCTDLWYHVEYDYLHYPEAINDMIESVAQFEEDTGAMVAINPHDDIWRYKHQIYYSLILLGPYRHYRTVKHTTFTCLASRAIFDKYRNHFDDAAEWLHKTDWVEDKTINQVWNKEDVMLFSPIPSLALHLMDESGKDPYINFEEFWDSVPKLWIDGKL
jgi:glycosyltransferase involved in cell wall biosynthesis